MLRVPSVQWLWRHACSRLVIRRESRSEKMDCRLSEESADDSPDADFADATVQYDRQRSSDCGGVSLDGGTEAGCKSRKHERDTIHSGDGGDGQAAIRREKSGPGMPTHRWARMPH